MKRAGLLLLLLFDVEVISLVAAESASSPATSLVFTNRLAREKSPYLLQHAHNPVDWYPWGEEAFSRAKLENKPIFLSVGYSTCHWCHVMERESFENSETAGILNDHFVCIKVDREERPDVDRVYMAFVQATTGGGGWPMNVWLTPDLKPFFGGTYFPPEGKFNLPGFPTLLKQIADAWQKDREKLSLQGDSFIKALQNSSSTDQTKPPRLSPSLLSGGYAELAATFDEKAGGFEKSPKFPRPVTLNFLFQIHAREGTNSEAGRHALEMNLFTLEKMASGGIHDHLGGGFHRYSVDRFWQVPHFEKMLYDQAQLARSYLEAFQITRDPDYERVARDILDYVRRDMTDSAGGFYSAEDADSLLEPGRPDRGEGAFYVWKVEEIEKVLGPSSAALFDFCYGVNPQGNVPEGSDPHHEFAGRNILIRKETSATAAAKFKLTSQGVEATLVDARQKLLAARSRRPRPLRDDKIITAWNGLMISAFARGYQVLNDPAYLQTALHAAEFARHHLGDALGIELVRSYREGASTAKGFADDYAFLIQGLLDLYEGSFDVKWLSWAVQLQEKQDALFWEEKRGGYFSTSNTDKSILVRTMEDYDGAEPSPNSVSILNVLRLSQMTGNAAWRQRAENALTSFAARLTAAPGNLPQMLVALDWHLSSPKQIILAGKAASAETRLMLQAVHRQFRPNKIILLADGGGGQEFLSARLEFIRTMKPIHDKTTAYVCENYVCQLPTDDLDRFETLLGR